jgi:hypothetical protein
MENKIDFKNFTIAEFNSFVKSINAYGDIEVSVSVGNNVNKEGTYTKKIDLKKLKDLSMSLGDGKEISVITGSENIYAYVVVYDNNYDKGYKEYTISLISKDDKEGLKSIVNAIIEKFKNGGSVNFDNGNPKNYKEFKNDLYKRLDSLNLNGIKGRSAKDFIFQELYLNMNNDMIRNWTNMFMNEESNYEWREDWYNFIRNNKYAKGSTIDKILTRGEIENKIDGLKLRIAKTKKQISTYETTNRGKYNNLWQEKVVPLQNELNELSELWGKSKYKDGGGVKKKSLMSMAHLVIADMRAEKIKDWYTKNHPTDDLGEELDEDVTFADLMNALNNKKEIYEVMGVGDSVIRERLFERLTWMYDESYDTIYNKWLDSDDYAQGGATKGFNYSIGGL